MIDKFSRVSIYEQIMHSIEQSVLSGLQPAGSQLPSLRELSTELGINPNTIARAYGELQRKGILQVAQGSGYFVSPEAYTLVRNERGTKLADIYALAGQLAMAGISCEQVIEQVKAAYATQEKGGETK